MTTHSMNHQQAVESMAAERYLLGEMTAEQRFAFEEHYVECAECLESVMFGSEFLDAGHQVAIENKTQRQAQPLPTWRERLLSVTSSLLRPAPAMAFALLCAFAIYQGVQLHNAREESRSPHIIASAVFVPAAARGGEATDRDGGTRGTLPLVNVVRGGRFALSIDLPSTQTGYSGYVGQLFNADGAKADASLSFEGAQFNQSNVEILFPPLTREGTYDLVIYGSKDEQKGSTEIARYRFVVKFQN